MFVFAGLFYEHEVKYEISDLKKDKGEKISDNGLKAETLNNFFSSVFTIDDTTNMLTIRDRPVLNTSHRQMYKKSCKT